ncbi:uncharacterized protein LOC129762250 [Toxorhynchites rutilus septentrionalis]|uniref:uncharacterized protein LOC129762250 n=1 Tax=Toxorhynchites rutilus septentrionalis TaxID=329112 RepID=UPI002479379B|nr:uncharacterized protein LOC129762250 [Toxorhynchites rutilus septentrionalis]
MLSVVNMGHVKTVRPGDVLFCLPVIFATLSVLVTRADPVPEPDPARILGKYIFSYHPSETDYHLSRQPLDTSNMVENDDYDSEPSASHSSYGHSYSGSESPGYMTSYTTSTKHGDSSGFDSDSYEDNDDRKNYYTSSSAYQKTKPIIPILQSYSIIHASKDSSAMIKNSDNYNNNYSSNESEEEAEYEQTYYKPPKVIHTKAKMIPISQHVEVERPVPVPYVKKIHVPIPKGVRIQIPHPVLVPVPQPYPVHVPVSQPVAVPVIREITIPIEKIVPYPVEKRVPVPIEKPVPYPVEKHVPVHIPQPYPVKVPVIKTIVHKMKPPRTIGFGSVTI